MKAKAPDPFGSLTALNALIALATGSEAEEACQIQAAIQFCGMESNGSPSTTATPLPAFETRQVLRRLVELHLKDRRSFGFCHWNIDEQAYDPLWVRMHTIQRLKKLAGYPEALFLVTGLRNALCPAGKPWTRKRIQCYREAISCLEALALRYKTPRTRLSLLFI